MESLQFQNDYKNVLGFEVPSPSEPTLIERTVSRCHDTGVGFYETLLIVLKMEWKKRTESAELPARNTFIPDSELYFRIFEERAECWASREGYDLDLLDLLLREMVAVELFNYGIKSPEARSFIERALKEKEILLQENAETLRHRYKETKEQWLMYQDELGERLLVLERIRLRNANVNYRWLQIFGKEYIPLMEQENRLDVLRRKTTLLEMNPELSATALNEKLKEHIKETEKQLNAMKLEFAYSGRSQVGPSESSNMSYEQLMNYRKNSKQLLRKIYLLIHPDMLRQHEHYAELTEYQKSRLLNLWNDVMALKEEEIGYSDVCLGHEYRSVIILMEKLQLARLILNNAGIDTDPGFIIEGDTIYDQIHWLEESITSMQSAIQGIQVEQKVLLEDDTIREREIMIHWPGYKQNELKREYKRMAEEFEAESNELEEGLKRHFEKRGQTDVDIKQYQENGQ